VVPAIGIKSKVHPGVAAIAGGALVVVGSVIAFGGDSGDVVPSPCFGLCMVASGSQHCGSGSFVGPVKRVVLDGVSRRKDGVCRR
jgi:hypothetical protein